MSAIAQIEPLDDGGALAVTFDDGNRARFHAVWLRDNALDATTRSPTNGQRLITVLDVPAGTRIEQARVEDTGALALRFTPGGAEARFEAGWLRRHVYDAPHPRTPGWTGPEVER